MKTAPSSYVSHIITSFHPMPSYESLKASTEQQTAGERHKLDIRNSATTNLFNP